MENGSNKGNTADDHFCPLQVGPERQKLSTLNEPQSTLYKINNNLVEGQKVCRRDAGVGLILVAHQHSVRGLDNHSTIHPKQPIYNIRQAVEVQA